MKKRFFQMILSLLLVMGVLGKGFSYASNFAYACEEAIPAVVFIGVKESPFEQAYGPDPLFLYRWIRPIYEYFWPSLFSHGSGFILHSDGYIVTNAHVIEGGTHICVAVQSPQLRIYEASIIGIDWNTDLAVLKIESPYELPHLNFGCSDEMEVGQEVIAIGAPLISNLESTVTSGIISAKERNYFGMDPVEGYLQTDANVHPGNSGGPLINERGEVIGIINWGFTYASGLNFVIPSNTATRVVDQILTKGIVHQGYIGVELVQEVESIFNRFHFDASNGALIYQVEKASPAEKAGIRRGDRIVMLNEKPIKSAKALRNQILTLSPNTKVVITLEREGKLLDVALCVGKTLRLPPYFGC
jgi:serine protease Do